MPIQLGARVVAGAVSGAAIGAAHDMLIVGAVLGIVGSLLGTFGGAAVRKSLAAAFGRDLPAGLIEDFIALAGAAAIVAALR